MGDIKMDYVIKTGFISWLNQEEERIDRYLDGRDLQNLVLEYIDEITKEDEVYDDELVDELNEKLELNEQEDNSLVRKDELGEDGTDRGTSRIREEDDGKE